MFQYAAGRSFARRRNERLAFDLSFYSKTPAGVTPRRYELGGFNIDASELCFLDGCKLKFFRSLDRGPLKTILRLFDFNFITETRPGFDPAIAGVKGGVYLDGYWQSEKYFKGIRNILMKEFSLKNGMPEKMRELSRLINGTNSVSLHIRRGDYFSDPRVNSVHGVCTADYYSKAVDRMASEIDSPRFFIFSDEPEWVRNNLKINFPMTIVADEFRGESFEELSLMSQCKHNIIANSSFSWWGAWLNAGEEKKVLAPKRWFNEGTVDYDIDDLLPEEWIKI
jgi:hypothetical protein